jgi:hypothetical protein
MSENEHIRLFSDIFYYVGLFVKIRKINAYAMWHS